MRLVVAILFHSFWLRSKFVHFTDIQNPCQTWKVRVSSVTFSMQQLFYYYGIFCKNCQAFLPLWEVPNTHIPVRVGLEPSWKYNILCDACQESTELSSVTRLFMVESSRRSVRFRAPKSGKGAASSS